MPSIYVVLHLVRVALRETITTIIMVFLVECTCRSQNEDVLNSEEEKSRI